MKTIQQKISFRSGGFTLEGVLHMPDIPNPPLVVGSHGLEGTMNSAKQMVLSRLLPENGISFFRFDHRGCGRSDGDFIKDTSLEKRTRDFLAAVAHVLGLGVTSRQLALFGSSMGGATCINAWESLTAMDLDLRGGVLCAAPVKSRTIENIPLEANGNRPALPLSFFRDNLLFDLRDRVALLHNLLIFHGDADEVVPVANAHWIFQAMQHPKKCIIQPGGDHQMSSTTDQAEFEREAPAWFRQLFT